MDQTTLVPLGFFCMIVAVSIGVPLARAFARSIDRRGDRASLQPGVDERLLQMQQSIDAVALEIERISEAQRFTTRLLADRAAGAPELPAGERGSAEGGSPRRAEDR